MNIERGRYKEFIKIFNEITEKLVEIDVGNSADYDSNFIISSLEPKKRSPIEYDASNHDSLGNLSMHFKQYQLNSFEIKVPYIRDKNLSVLEPGGNFPLYLPTLSLDFSYEDDYKLYQFIADLGNFIYSDDPELIELFRPNNFAELAQSMQAKSIRTALFTGILSIILVAINISNINNKSGMEGLVDTLTSSYEEINSITQMFDFDTLTKLSQYGFISNAQSLEDYRDGIKLANKLFRRESYGSGMCPVSHKKFKNSNGRLVELDQSTIEKLSIWVGSQIRNRLFKQ